jgi:hypothetical protein
MPEPGRSIEPLAGKFHTTHLPFLPTNQMRKLEPMISAEGWRSKERIEEYIVFWRFQGEGIVYGISRATGRKNRFLRADDPEGLFRALQVAAMMRPD